MTGRSTSNASTNISARAAKHRDARYSPGATVFPVFRRTGLARAGQYVFHAVVKAVVEIAYDLGFNSASDFNHAFRRAYGMSPLDFRALTVGGRCDKRPERG
ncbi:helix-turn-helix domain-containing protein [Trinickia terrae]|uniref:Helix-turn-helix domain-containing protein n=1 Tax=Trinickia terrae TaxID=2571161 RepID=A0A4U1I3D3_9BURK|nr:helix-turn-helix domain-containing protein [Trinickia terrae]TKC87739.1 helix-turn-helix domain-containing protein [Trinickia terrae]